jgi:hypothetical protein
VLREVKVVLRRDNVIWRKSSLFRGNWKDFAKRPSPWWREAWREADRADRLKKGRETCRTKAPT